MDNNFRSLSAPGTGKAWNTRRRRRRISGSELRAGRRFSARDEVVPAHGVQVVIHEDVRQALLSRLRTMTQIW